MLMGAYADWRQEEGGSTGALKWGMHLEISQWTGVLCCPQTGGTYYSTRHSPHSRPHRTAPHRTAPRRTAPHRTAPHRTAPHRCTAKILCRACSIC
jgi:hypothetical protein